ncbi:hypothetical protein, partial [Nitrosomonas communis]
IPYHLYLFCMTFLSLLSKSMILMEIVLPDSFLGIILSIPDSLLPVARLLCSDFVNHESFDDVKKDFLNLLPELRRHAEWTQNNYVYIDDKELKTDGRFIVTPVSGMNPFSRYGKCLDFRCRLKNTRRFAQTLGLYSDSINIHDPFTTLFLDNEDWSDYEIVALYHDITVLHELVPLFNKGVISFLNPSAGFCNSCYSELIRKIGSLAEETLDDYKSEIKMRREEHGFSLDTGIIYEPPLVQLFEHTSSSKKRITKKIALKNLKKNVSAEIKEILMSFYSKSVQESAIFSNSRVTFNALRNLEGRSISNDIEAWELAHSTDLPWIKELSVQQVVQLREEAKSALPQLREKFAINIASNKAYELNHTEDQTKNLIRELRASTEEVAAELSSLNIRGERRFNNVAGMLGLTVAIYGYGTDLMSPELSLTTLLSTLGLIHTFSKRDEEELRKITSKPGYVFVKAKELLSHAN